MSGIASAEVVHRVGTAALLLGMSAASARVLVRYRTGRRVRRRGAALFAVAVAEAPEAGRAVPMNPAPRGTGWRKAASGLGQWPALLGVVLTGWFLMGGLTGWATGLLAAWGARRWQRTHYGEAAEAEAERAARAAESLRQMPMAADLLAACISAGAGPREAAEAVGTSLGGPVGTRLARTAAEIRLGSDPVAAWGRFGGIPGGSALARCLERAGTTGAPAAEPVARLAGALRAERASAALARAQRAGVLITGPVGLCFLPAFLSVGVAPVVVGLAGGLLRTG
ncbi:type II secretion system F family protein [Streptomyces sp. NPDC057682]|uniref:type II secretion system F family protein n=1 Tax=unclassified Streptomyces TaxID=2593676 RepID=UPI00364AAECA